MQQKQMTYVDMAKKPTSLLGPQYGQRGKGKGKGKGMCLRNDGSQGNIQGPDVHDSQLERVGC